ncbi:MerR family transcriptional regulator [Shinella zoogloeoides]|uniref:HTH merR-type domain-containing protein n=1 Tax=Shinella zoogloeoides TaxID=352475 RepID=A0A6N8THP1_SHIZO|nr:hypothetical protein [Shinella sp.]MXO01945.1 hypothetical protein [Shinella zoogloeoides]TAA49816.1 hypothetical protein EXZ48_33850 [Shinella sp. JR1-6]
MRLRSHAERSDSNHRRYSNEESNRLMLIRHACNLGGR